MLALLASVLIATNATPQELVASCRAMIPADVELSGRLVLRNRRGVVKAEHAYVLTRAAGQTKLLVDGVPYAPPSDSARAADGILGTDVTWSDLSLDYLGWRDVSFDAEREGETVHGQVCAVVVLRQGARTVRAWIDRKTGALLQAEEFDGDRRIRRLWGARLKKFGDRWMANVLEVETEGAGHRTKITVEELK